MQSSCAMLIAENGPATLLHVPGPAGTGGAHDMSKAHEDAPVEVNAGAVNRPTTPEYPAWIGFARAQADRFWSHVVKSPGCWEWAKGKDKDGYGKFAVSLPRVGGKEQQVHVRAHRVAYLLANGPIPRGLLVLHDCDNPPCCNPAHLHAGTQLKNRAEAKARGRVPRGENHVRAKITEAQAREALRLRATGVSARDVGSKIGLTEAAVYQIGKYNWLHLVGGGAPE